MTSAWNRRAPSPTTEGVEASGDDLDLASFNAGLDIRVAKIMGRPTIESLRRARAAIACVRAYDRASASAPAGAPDSTTPANQPVGELLASAPEPTPAALREWAEWFEGTERVVVPTEAGLNHPSDLLRRIADAMEGRA